MIQTRLRDLRAETRLERAGVEPTPRRTAVLRCLLDSDSTLPPREILERLRGDMPMNKVTLYRILDLFVDARLVERHSSGGRAFHYCAAGAERGEEHCHFHCTRCDRTQCVALADLPFTPQTLSAALPMRVERMELRFDGVCRDCLRAGS